MPSEALHVRGVVLPEQEHRDLWIVDGRVTYEPVSDATTAAEGWVLPGLVDAHCHVGLDEHGGVPGDVQERQALEERDAGVLLIRDAGVPPDTRWIDAREDLPRVIRAGRHLARTKRYIRNYGHEIEPEDLVAYVVAEAQRGDGWVKLVGDWIDRDKGDLGPCWPREALEAAITAAHEHGARVTAHVFGEDALPDLLGAGIDCIEHGPGLTDETIATMATRGVALVPTLINIDEFPAFAAQGEARFPAYAQHMRDLYARRDETFRAAYEAGVPLYAGTDAGGVVAHGLVGREVMALHRAGLTAEDALAAASWRARSWLGHPGLDEGDPADLVVLAADPLDDLEAVTAPARVLLRGRVVV
ncbi:MAG: amidohydrolase family protein [Actinomycetes bacterium]